MAAPPTQTLSEDDIYRTSSQFRLWSFSPASLAAARRDTNSAAAKHVRDILGQHVDTLTPAEELALVRRSCHLALNLIDHTNSFGTEVKVSATQFLKRFYVYASCMEYPPSKMISSAVFLATKVHGSQMTVSQFASIAGKSEQSITAPEFKIAQGNRFAFEVRSPYRAMEGGKMMLYEIGKGTAPVPDANKLQAELQQLCGDKQPWQHRIEQSVDKVKALLKTTALLSDAYLLFTPPQIWLGALLSVDLKLASLYLKFALSGVPAEQFQLIQDEINACADMLARDAEDHAVSDAEIKRLNAKLKLCTNPETSDLVELNAAQKRDPDPTAANGHASKKLKTEKGAIEDPFGPPLVKPEPK